ncbi:hypothetical protein ACOSQ4_026223 [Xanthoceras sorbifolium]
MGLDQAVYYRNEKEQEVCLFLLSLGAGLHSSASLCAVSPLAHRSSSRFSCSHAVRPRGSVDRASLSKSDNYSVEIH